MTSRNKSQGRHNCQHSHFAGLYQLVWNALLAPTDLALFQGWKHCNDTKFSQLKMAGFAIVPQHLITSGKHGNQNSSELFSNIIVKQPWCTVHVQILWAVHRTASTCSKAKVTEVPPQAASTYKGCISQCPYSKKLCISWLPVKNWSWTANKYQNQWSITVWE